MRLRPTRITALALGLLGLFGCAGERPDNLGAQDGLLVPCPRSPNCVSSQATDERHHIAPLTFADEPDTAWARLRAVLTGRVDAALIEDQPGYLRLELRTTLFVDDAEFLLDPANRVIHVRSASRLGYSDLGKNRSRMEEIRRQFALPEGP
ncbi:MAG: DUF1499 domain-containing protein [Desulfobulbus sp.]|jgi:uncharacterized protein (DUF1499 family)|nr:DUF1499 domain-containing protein [Desulfobulbus sp.]